MKAVSPKRARQQRRRRKVLERSHGPERCQFPGGCVREAVDGHEVWTRARGGDPTDVFNIVLLCREHHDWVGDHPAEAKALGLLDSAPNAERVRNVCEPVRLPAMPPKRPITLRVSPDAEQWVADAQTETGASQSVVLRAMLSVATQHRAQVVAKIRALQEV